jgi:hypothetical protein
MLGRRPRQSLEPGRGGREGLRFPMSVSRAIPGLILAAASCSLGFAQQAPFTLSIRGVHNEPCPQEIHIEVTVRNSSDRMLCVDTFFKPVLDYTFDIQNAYGHPAPETPLLYKLRHPDPNPLGLVSVGGGCVRSGGSTGGNILISDFYDLTEPGTYTIQVSRRLERVSPDWVKSNIVTILVGDSGWRELPN